jgi:hypothetical protein
MAALFLMGVGGAYAQAPLCLPYESETVVLTGMVHRTLQIAFIEMPFDRSIPEDRVWITATLFHAVFGRHHTKR